MDWLSILAQCNNSDCHCCALAFITYHYVRLTGRILEETRLMRLDAHKPEIVVSIRPHETHICCVMLYIENIGTGPARSLQFVTDLSFKPDGDRSLEEIGFLKNGIDYLGPGQKIEHFLVSVIGKLDELKQTPLEIGVNYKDSMKCEYKNSFHLDFGEWEGLSGIGGSPLFEIAKAIKDINKHLRSTNQ